MSYVWKEDARYSGDPNIVGRELEAIRSGGSLQADDVVIRAADPSNPLHRYFEWDDTRAAQEHRKAQARHLIRSIRIVPADHGPMHSYVRVRINGQSSYEAIEVAAQDESMWHEVLTEARTDLDAMRRRLVELRAVSQDGRRLRKLVRLIGEARSEAESIAA